MSAVVVELIASRAAFNFVLVDRRADAVWWSGIPQPKLTSPGGSGRVDCGRRACLKRSFILGDTGIQCSVFGPFFLPSQRLNDLNGALDNAEHWMYPMSVLLS